MLKSKYFNEFLLKSMSNTDIDQDVGGGIDDVVLIKPELGKTVIGCETF